MRNPGIGLTLAFIGALLAAAPARAQTPPAPTNTPGPANSPEQSSLLVGTLQIGSSADLEVDGMDINITNDSVVYSYLLKNAGTRELSLTASVSMPELQASADGSQTWVLASNNPENPVGLTITAAGDPVAPKAEVHAYALGLDRTAEITGEHLPLMPFGPETEKALAALSPETVNRLAALGIISPRDPDQPTARLGADWTFDGVLSWRQTLPPGKPVPIVVKFTPVKAEYRLVKGDQDDLDDLKDDVCLQPQVLGTLQSRLKSGGAWKATDISLAVDGPAHWVDDPAPTLSVQKPQGDAIVAFCGMDDKTANRATVLGVAPDNTSEIRIIIFTPGHK
ncbi:MAG: DUF4424 family protein [Xanthobacteraceae bacterium]